MVLKLKKIRKNRKLLKQGLRLCLNPKCTSGKKPRPLSDFYRNGKYYTEHCRDCIKRAKPKTPFKLQNDFLESKDTGTKICTDPQCHVPGLPQPLSNFKITRHDPVRYNSKCKACTNRQQREAYARAKPRRTGTRENWRTK